MLLSSTALIGTEQVKEAVEWAVDAAARQEESEEGCKAFCSQGRGDSTVACTWTL